MERIGRYEIVGEIGRGAMGRVLRAIDPAIGRTLAIKVIRLDDIADPSEQERLRERLAREARSAGALSHPNIVTIYDAGEHGDLAFIAMEYVDGTTLADRLKSGQPLTPEQLARILAETAAALDYAHSKGVVHRDVKPANIMITTDGAAKITDFGIAKFGSQQMTSTGTLLGTPSYMSPEQIDGRSIDGRADQFSLGVIAYELLTGEKPFQGETLPALLMKIVRQQPAAPHLLNPRLSERVTQTLERAMRKSPDIRFPTCSEFQQALKVALDASPGWRPLEAGAASAMATVEQALPEIDAPIDGTTEDTASPAGTEPVQSSGPPPPRRRRRQEEDEPSPRRWPWVAVLVLLAGASATAFYYRDMWLGPQPGPATTATQVASDTAPPVAPEEPKPSPMPPAGEQAKPEPVEETAAPKLRPPAGTSKPDEPPPGPAQVEITSQPSGARISIDNGVKTCVTPCPISLDAGRRFLAASLDGHRRSVKVIEVPDVTSVHFTLDRMMGTLMVRSNPPGASILLDGNLLPQKTPATLSVPAGRRKLELRLEGRPPYEEEIEVKDQVISNIGVNW
jgi:serine/threonine-protein kinase